MITKNLGIKNMKKVVLVLAVVFATVAGVKAQESPKSAKVKVNVVLNPFQSIELGGSGQPGAVDVVNLVYNNANDYKNGVNKLVDKQLKVSSVGSGYKISASLGLNGGSTGTFKKVQGGGVENIDASQLLEIAIGKTGSLNGATNGNTAAATMEFGPFGANSTGESSVLDEFLDVKYFGKQLGQDMVRKLMGNQNKAEYTIDVVYTIAVN